MPKPLPHREHVLSFLRLDAALSRLRNALDEGDLSAAAARLEQAEETLEASAPAFTVAEAAERLAVTPPTVRAWIERGLLNEVGKSPKTVAATSVLELERKLARLREVSKDKRQWAALLQRARDQEEMELPGAREGLAEAVQMKRRASTRARKRSKRSRVPA